jgi:hypothetical protein
MYKDDGTVLEKCSNDDSDPACSATFQSVTEPLVDSVAVTPAVITPGPVVVKVPVVLAEPRIVIPVLSTIRLENSAFEIKRIKKNVFVTQCHLMPNSADGVANTGILFLEGFVRKNIEYATASCVSGGVVSGSIFHTTGQVNFSVTTRVTFLRPPVFTTNPSVQELELFEGTLKRCDICAEPVIGRDPCEQDFIHTENFNEKVFCELVTANIVEADIHKNPTPLSCNNPQEQTFITITEKLLLDLTIKILQKQQVRVTAIGL